MNNQTEVKTRPSFGVLWQKYGTMGIFLLLLAVLTIAKPSSIFNPDSIPQILKQSAVNILLALGEFFAILIAGIDLSVGAVAGLVGMLTAMLMVNGIPVIPALLLGILIGTMIGFCNGMLVISDSRNIYGFPASFTKTMSASVLYIPVPVIIALIVAAACAFFTTKCKAGRNIYALGGNMEAAWYSGVNVNLHRLLVFMISGTCSGIAGIVLLGRVGAAAPTAGTGYETYAIAATIIGGTSFMGGKGKILGVVIGGMIIGIINYGMTALMIPSSYQKIVMGALIIISVAIDHFVAKAKN